MIDYQTTTKLSDAILARVMLRGLESYYPDFDYWFVNKCIPGIVLGNDTLIVAREHGQIVGVALGKKAEETKLRCVRVMPDYQNKGVGLHLIDRTLKQLDCDKPLVTVSEEMLHLYSRAFINRYHFDLTQVDKGLYRRGKLEYIFNKGLDHVTGHPDGNPHRH